jgi:Leucine-rich repeat (LRR) protein
LAALKSLSLDRNRLSVLPDSICELSQLESLSLAGNRLTTLPASMGKLASLKVLTVNGNMLSREEVLRVRKVLPKTMIVE